MPEAENENQQTADDETTASVEQEADGDLSTEESVESTEGPDAGAEAPVAAGGESEVPPLPDFSRDLPEAAASSIELLKDVDLDVKIELGRVEMTVEDILRLSNGSVVELDKLAGDPVDVLVNEQLVAHGEVLVINDSFCVRINDIVAGVSERFDKM